MSGSIPQEFIRDLISSSDIVSLIDSYVPLKKKGKDHWGLCPFCNDGNNPSFSVSAQKQFYYCFKCSETGNIVSFLQSHLGMNFVETIESLAASAGQQVPYSDKKEGHGDNKLVYEALDEASKIFQKNLLEHSSANDSRIYLKEQRKISPETCHLFEVGYSLNSWNYLTDSLIKKGFSKEIIISAGLAKENQDKKLFDIFRDRIIFPIRDTRGRTVGFGGRVMNDKDQTKYLNTGDTPVFKKSNQLYGLYETNKFKKGLNKIFVVEGYMDVISMFEQDINNSVATLGIASNRFHVQKILQLVDKVIFCFDGDEAGRGAAWNALKNCLPVVKDEAEMRFLFLPEGEDPASLLENEDKEDFLKREFDSLVLSDYFIKRLTEVVGTISTLEKKASLASKAMVLLHSMPNGALKNLLELEVSKITGLGEEDIKKLSKPLKGTYQSSNIQKGDPSTIVSNIFEEASFSAKALKVLLQHPKLVMEINIDEALGDNKKPEVMLLTKVANKFKQNIDCSLAELLQELDSDEKYFIGNLAANSETIGDTNMTLYLQDCITKILAEDSSSRIRDLKKMYMERQLSDDETFELQQHLVSNLGELKEDDRLLLKNLSQKK